MIEIRKLRRSIKHALRGVKIAFKTEQSFRLQSIFSLFVIILAIYFQITSFEWVIILLMSSIILSLELFNSIIERILDAFRPRIHPIVKDIKDIMAATVLIMSMAAVMVGVTIFYPYILALV
jgi:diacylglycerol kinase